MLIGSKRGNILAIVSLARLLAATASTNIIRIANVFV